MTSAPKPLPIAPCPNPECRSACRDYYFIPPDPGDDVDGKHPINRPVIQVQCDKCQYAGPLVKIIGHDMETATKEAIRLHNLIAGNATEAVPNYRGMEYPLEQLPAIWRTLAEELRENAKESKADDPELARCFESRAISIIACAEQLKWSLAHGAPPTASVKITPQSFSVTPGAAREIVEKLLADGSIYEDGSEEYGHRIAAIIRKHQQVEGWVSVPREPDDGQLIQMFRAFHADKPEILEDVMGMSDLSDIQAKHLRDGYIAALAAAPKLGEGK